MNPLQRKIGPFPLGVWLLIGAAGVGVGLIVRRYMDGLDVDASPAEPDPTAAAAVGLGFTTQGAAYVPVNAGAGAGDNYGGSNDPPKTNYDWARVAIRFLISRGADPIIADAAIRKYLEGKQLTQQEAALVSQALKEVGVPPEGVPPAEVAPVPPAPTPTTKPTTETPPKTNLTPAGAAYVATQAAVVANMNAGIATPEDLSRAKFFAICPGDSRLNNTARWYYRLWLDQNFGPNTLRC